MTLSMFHPKLMRFLYEITKQEKYLSYVGISKTIIINNKKLTPQTVYSWLSFLKKNGFSYYPTIAYEKIGLSVLWVFTNIKDINKLKYKQFINNMFKIYSNDYNFVIEYLIPKDIINYFKNTIDDLFIEVNTPLFLYSKFDKCVDINGNLNFENNTIDEINIFRLKDYIFNIKSNTLDINLLKRNPLIVPIIFEYRNNFSSVNVWNSMKQKLKDSLWKYIKRKKEIDDNIGIKKVQKTIRNINGHLHQVVVDYKPFYKKSILMFGICKPNDIEMIIKNSLFVKFYYNNRNNIFISLTNSNGMYTFYKNIDFVYIIRQEDTNTTPYLFFNPINMKWIL